MAYVPKLYHLCSYCCKFTTVRTDVVKRNNVLYFAFSLLSLLVLISSLSLFTSDPASLNRERTKWHFDRIEEKQIIFMGKATPIRSSPSSSSSEAQAAWARPLRSSTSSSSSSLPLQSHRSLFFFFGGWLFWLLVVGWFWLMVVGWSGCGCEIWVDIGVWVWVDRVLIVVFVWVFFW